MDISEIITFVEKRRPGFSSRIVSGDESLINDILVEARNPLPKLYLQYLKAVGDDPAEFKIKWLSLNAIDVVDYIDSRGTYPRDRFTLFALHRPQPGDIYQHYYFDHKRATGVDCLIVSFEDIGTGEIKEESISPLFSSFHEFLLFWGVGLFCLNSRPFQRTLQFRRFAPASGDEPRDRMATCRDVALQLGFEPVLPPTELCWGGELENTAIRIDQSPKSEHKSFFVDIASSDQREVLRICETLEDILGPSS
jgi:hypothetical protein